MHTLVDAQNGIAGLPGNEEGMQNGRAMSSPSALGTNKRNSVVSSVEKILLPVSVLGMFFRTLVLASLLLVWPACAQPAGAKQLRESGRQGSGQFQSAQRTTRDSQRAGRSGAKKNPSGNTRKQQRLSAEERRQLRNDIQSAGREIYPARR